MRGRRCVFRRRLSAWRGTPARRIPLPAVSTLEHHFMPAATPGPPARPVLICINALPVEREKQLQEDKKQREEEARKRAELQEREQQQRKERAEREARERELKRERETHAAQLCDQLAANPTDANRVGDGVPYESLREQARQAVENCQIAAKQSPNELRFQYQWARALQTIDRDKAFDMMRQLVKKHYPAAFDNAGWLFITERKNFTDAVSHFRMGVQLGDPDSMVSLVEMYDRGHASPRHEREARNALLERAARLGHLGASERLGREQAKAAEVERQRALQQD